MDKTGSGRVPQLDGMRGVAVLAVLCFHSDFSWAKGGAFGVDVFFTLSGFLITFLLVKEREESGTFSFKLFYLRRALRLLPCLLCVVVACCVTESIFGAYDQGPSIWRRSLWALCYVSNWVWAAGGGDNNLGALNATW